MIYYKNNKKHIGLFACVADLHNYCDDNEIRNYKVMRLKDSYFACID